MDLASYNFNPYAIPTFLVSAAILALGLAVLFRERASTVSLLFFLLTFSASLWLFSVSWMYLSVDEDVALWWARSKMTAVILIPPAIYHFTTILLQSYQRTRKVVWLSWILALFFIAELWNSATMIRTVQLHPWGYYPRFDWLSFPFLAFFFSLMAASLYQFQLQARSGRPGSSYRLRARGLLPAFAVGYLGSVDYLPAYGYPVYPFGYLAVFGFVLLAARTIWRYRLVDITPAFAAREIVHAMADALLVLDSDGIVQVANRAAGQLFERAEKDIEGSHLSTLTGSIPGADPLNRKILSGAIRDFEVRIQGQKGEAKFGELFFFRYARPGEPAPGRRVHREGHHRAQARRGTKPT